MPEIVLIAVCEFTLMRWAHHEGEVDCPNCKVYISHEGSRVASFNELRVGRTIQCRSISEASPSLGVGAYTASEMMCLRCLESILRRVYRTNEIRKAEYKEPNIRRGRRDLTSKFHILRM